MINTLLDISGKIDEDSAAALAHVKAAADSLGISFFIIGALARDILLKLHFGLPPHRATLDLDLGVSVETWGHFSSLKNELTENHRFKGTNQLQRLQYERILVDIVPFGPIAGPAHTVRWPPDESFQMSTTGFETKKAAIRLLGRDMAKISNQSSGLQISEILAEETNEASKMRLALDIAQETRQIGRDPQEILMLVAKLRQGFEEIFISAGPKGH